MKKIVHALISAVLFLMILSAGLASHHMSGEQDHQSYKSPQSPQSFDTLFPKTWYTKAVESCIFVWGALDDLIACPSTSAFDRATMVDATIGRLVFAQFCLDLVHAQEPTLLSDDLAYLARVVNIVTERCNKVADLLEQDRAYCIQRVVQDLKKKIFLLQSKDASFSADH